jgi:hypothetical protein
MVGQRLRCAAIVWRWLTVRFTTTGMCVCIMVSVTLLSYPPRRRHTKRHLWKALRRMWRRLLQVLMRRKPWFFILGHFLSQSVYLMIQVSDSDVNLRTIVHVQTVLVMHLFASLVPTHSDAPALMQRTVHERIPSTGCVHRDPIHAIHHGQVCGRVCGFTFELVHVATGCGVVDLPWYTIDNPTPQLCTALQRCSVVFDSFVYRVYRLFLCVCFDVSVCLYVCVMTDFLECFCLVWFSERYYSFVSHIRCVLDDFLYICVHVCAWCLLWLHSLRDCHDAAT